ncbi:MAG: sirohydrochlorin chelatase [Geodermatophilaceae bacterium]
MAEPRAVLLINHGSRQPHAATFTHDAAAALRREDPDRIVRVSFLELTPPSPAHALHQLARAGITDVQVVPLLFSAGHHYRIDIPAAVHAALESVPGMRVQIAPPLLTDTHDDLIAALDARLDEAIQDQPSSAGHRPDGLVLLAAGSSDGEARAQVRGLADAWGRARMVPAEAAFCDLRGGDVRAAMAKLSGRGAYRIACGSLFLATGRLLDAGRHAAANAGAGTIAGPLGLTPPLLGLLRRRCKPAVVAG